MKFEDDWMAGELLDMRLARAVPKAREVLAGWSHEDLVDLWGRFWAANHWLAAQEEPEWFDALRIVLWEAVNPALAQQGERPSQLAGGVFPGRGLKVEHDILSTVRRYGSDDFLSFQIAFLVQQERVQERTEHPQPENPFQWLTDQYGGPAIMAVALLGEAAQALRSMAPHAGERRGATGDPMHAVLLHTRLESKARARTERSLDELTRAQEREAKAKKEQGSEGGTKSSKERLPLRHFMAQLMRESPDLYELAHESPSSAARRILDTLPPDSDPRYFPHGVDEWACSSDGEKVVMEEKETNQSLERVRSALIETYIPKARQIIDDERSVKVQPHSSTISVG